MTPKARLHGKQPSAECLTPDGLTTLAQVYLKHNKTSALLPYREKYDGTRTDTALQAHADMIAGVRCLYPSGTVAQKEAQTQLDVAGMSKEDEWHLADELSVWGAKKAKRLRAML